QEKVEVDLVGALHFGRAGPRPDGRDVLARVDLVVRRDILAEGQAAHGTGEDVADHGEVEVHGVERWRLHLGLLTPGEAGRFIQVEHGPLAARPQQEVSRRWGAGVDLVPDLFQNARRA